MALKITKRHGLGPDAGTVAFYCVVSPKRALGREALRDRFIGNDRAEPPPALGEDSCHLVVHEDPPGCSKNMLDPEDLSAVNPRMAPITPKLAGCWPGRKAIEVFAT